MTAQPRPRYGHAIPAQIKHWLKRAQCADSPPRLLLVLAQIFPTSVLRNPVMPLLSLSDPATEQRIRDCAVVTEIQYRHGSGVRSVPARLHALLPALKLAEDPAAETAGLP
jgi:hypothetical protein